MNEQGCGHPPRYFSLHRHGCLWCQAVHGDGVEDALRNLVTLARVVVEKHQALELHEGSYTDLERKDAEADAAILALAAALPPEASDAD